MAYIKVDYNRFEAAAAEIDNYIAQLKKRMSAANGEIAVLASSWKGSDFSQFKAQWDTLTASDSAYDKLIKSLKSYADYLRFASKQYKDAQTNAMNNAQSLPK